MLARQQVITLPDGRSIEADLVFPKTSSEGQNTYELADGTLLILKLVVTEVWRATTERDPSGNPLYVIKSSNVLTVIPHGGARQ